MPAAFPGCFTPRFLLALAALQGVRLRVWELSVRVGGGFLDLLAPGWCRSCSAPCPAAAPLCSECERQAPWIEGACDRCGLPVIAAQGAIGSPSVLSRSETTVASCSACVNQRWRFSRALALGEHRGSVRDLVLRHKYHADLAALRFVAPRLAALLDRLESDSPRGPPVLCCVPQHPLKTLLRGRDPARELAEAVAQKVGSPAQRLLRKIRWTRAQSRLSREERRRRPRGSFRVRRRVSVPGHVVLIDDVVTTGTTVSECAKALLEAGARRVDVIAIARAPDG